MKNIILISLLVFAKTTFLQNSSKIITSDIDNFWVAYDSIQTTDIASKKIDFINKLYIEKGSIGLQTFMKLRNYSDKHYIKLIENYPRFWNSIRPNTLTVKTKTEELVKAVERFRRLYSKLKDAEMYFTIGGLRSAGTVYNNMVLVGTEMGTATPRTDVSEFKSDWLKNVFADQALDNIVSLNIHEYIHTQQKPNESGVLLHQVIREGTCDFIAELVLGKPLKRKYITYGAKHFERLKQKLKEEMFSGSYINWLYNGGQKGKTADLGYYMGYEICKSYYNNARDKTKAIQEIIELDYNNKKEITQFLRRSGFYEEGFNKKKLMKSYEAKQPFIVKFMPFENGATNVSPKTKEFVIEFSREMNPRDYSISTSEKGEKAYPLGKTIGFDDRNQLLTFELVLEPNKEYEFIINCDRFTSKDNYPLKGGGYLVKFKTK